MPDGDWYCRFCEVSRLQNDRASRSLDQENDDEDCDEDIDDGCLDSGDSGAIESTPSQDHQRDDWSDVEYEEDIQMEDELDKEE